MINFLIGVFFGVLIGVIIMSILIVASDSDDWSDENENNRPFE